MPPSDGNTLGSANVRITGDVSDLNTSVNQAKQKVEELGGTTESLIENFRDLDDEATAAFRKIGEEAEKAGTSGEIAGEKTVKSFIGLATAHAAMTAIRNVAKAIEASAEFIDSKFGDGAAKAEAFIDKIQDKKPAAQLDELRKKQVELNSELGKNNEAWNRNIDPFNLFNTGRSSGVIQKELDQVNRYASIASDRVLKEKNQKEDEALLKKRAKDIQYEDDLAQIQELSLSGEAKQLAAIERRKDTLAKLIQLERDTLLEKKKYGTLDPLIDDGHRLSLYRAEYMGLVEERTKIQSNAAEKQREKEEMAMERLAGKHQKQAELRIALEERIAAVRINGIIKAQSEYEKLIAMQEKGFTAADSGGSVAAQIEAMTERLASAFRQSGGASN